MTAATYNGSRTFSTIEPPCLPPQQGELQIAVSYTGLCGTDLHIFHGDMDARVSMPAIIGHEMSGVIAALGDGVTGWAVGQPVTVMPTLSCGSCAACRRGHTHICHKLDFVGIDSDGSMQSNWNVPAEIVVALPDSLALDEAALIEPTAVAVHDVRRSRLAAGDFAVVIGGGPVGQLIASVAQHRGARVVLVELDPGRRAIAKEAGIRAIDPREQNLLDLVTRETDGAGADVAFEVSGAAAGVNLAVEVLTTRGRLVMVAIHPKPKEIDLHRFFWRELEMFGARLYQREDFEEAVQLVADEFIPARRLISRVVSLHDVEEGFHALESGGAMKVLVDCRATAEAAS
ncbi:(R,R)-butanediol dehydrogenase/meso-butanediol dehydrogenase/diacetyl reductase [Arthrobacter sp. V4I6]|uniref:zinc-dependent alcohol dehydrogenase n=1 Tax=unclassified Arthrobacter TaxID=235627 RepID=UPI00277F6D01|nr:MULTISPECIES: alcohol dehydrogenase catalytic domain-containing protein [unclassified Arthrobacter]MDQ0823131.1 (R,R)-butanediol dehydrogenase/meso-butanediol dehydrogenase/diacetyl reductase [Arthrobacter sp. V1I7]MDQ0852762.1 (R,R)-butanediol dehydrogenase/meso-butanediol dehydrogenase/diacetyl reductase [Arthrobacter sp. V4I6]